MTYSFLCTTMIGLTLIASSALCFAVYKWINYRRALTEAQIALRDLELHFSPITNLDEERGRIQTEIEQLDQKFEQLKFAYHTQFEKAKSSCIQEIEAIKASYREKKEIYDHLASEVAIFDDRLAFAEMGVYEPHFDFSDSEEYKQNILRIRENQREMISLKTAVFCTTSWTLDGSQSKGQTMTNRAIRLTLRAFNNECEAAIANTRWNNVNAMEKRIVKAKEQIDNLNSSSKIFISDDFLKLKLEELYLTHEYREKLKHERDERAEAARLQREEQRLLRDMEEAERQEEHYTKLLEKAKLEAANITGERISAYDEQIKLLEKQLEEAHAKAERAKAMAEKTRSGYVYIISNIGSFGEGVVKIGLTRRLDPLDRVRELGDASVPFIFDTHAIIYSDDAPLLERMLHAEFEQTRINTQNYRKEFFRASLDEVEVAVKRLAPDAPFFKDIEAQEYRETLYKRQLLLEQNDLGNNSAFPDQI